MSAFRLGLLNPNTTVADTEAMTAIARAALPDAERPAALERREHVGKLVLVTG